MGVEATIGSLSLKTVQSDWEKNWQWKWTYWLEQHQGSLKNPGAKTSIFRRTKWSPWSTWIFTSVPRSELSNPTRKPLLLSAPPHALVLNGGLKKPRCASAKTRTKRFLRIWVTYKSSVSLSACLDTVQLPHPAGHLSWCNRFIR